MADVVAEQNQSQPITAQQVLQQPITEQQRTQDTDDNAKMFVEKLKSRLGISPGKTAPEPIVPTTVPTAATDTIETVTDEVIEKEEEVQEMEDEAKTNKTAQKDAAQVGYNLDFDTMCSTRDSVRKSGFYILYK